MKTVIVRLLLWVVATAVLAFVALAVTLAQQEPSGDPKAFQVDRANVDVAVQPDASLVVTEDLTFTYDGDFSGAYRDIPLQPGVTASDFSLSDREQGDYRTGGSTELGSSDLPGTFGVEEIGTTERVVWHYRQTGGERTFKLRYRVQGAALAYSDALIVPWAPWGDQWTFWLNELTATFRVPGGRAPTASWIRPDGLGDHPQHGSFTMKRAKPGQQIALTMAYPRSVVSSIGGAQRRSGNGLEITRAADERANAGGGFVAFASTVTEVLPAIIVLITLLIGVVSFVLYRRGREYDHGVPEHLPQPPSQQPPAIGYALANEGGYDERIVLATLLDLVDRGFYTAEPTEGKELDLRLAVPERRPTQAVAPYEQEVLDFFDGLLAKGGPCALEDLADRIPKHDSTWRDRWNRMNTALRSAEDGQISWDRDLRGARWLVALAVVAVYALLLACSIARTGYFGPPIAGLLSGLLLLFLFPGNWLRRRDPESIQEGAQWAAFAKWTKDFPNLDDDPPATLALWRRVLVYAVAFGTAERVIKSGRIPAPLADQDDGWSRGMMHGASYGALSGSSFGSGFSSQVAPKSSSSSGGGGGGGGFSGGGGGGAW
ncbi:MAG: DUF2207 domain-containing protein [Patulibacter minatonensis]